MTDFPLVSAGDSALLLRLGQTIDPALNARALGIALRLREAGASSLRDVVVGYASVTVYFDPLVVESAELRERILRVARNTGPRVTSAARLVALPTVYGGDAGPDLEDVAAFASCSGEEVIARHTGREYRVFLLGFLPGFPYMGIVDERIAMPRRDSPRARVPAGSVGIAGRQTGVYPTASPGGWRLIGRTAAELFDHRRPEPALLQPGDAVRFHRA